MLAVVTVLRILSGIAVLFLTAFTMHFIIDKQLGAVDASSPIAFLARLPRRCPQ